MTRAVNTEPLFHSQIVKQGRKKEFMCIQMDRIEISLSNQKAIQYTERENSIRTGCVTKVCLQIPYLSHMLVQCMSASLFYSTHLLFRQGNNDVTFILYAPHYILDDFFLIKFDTLSL